MKSSPPGRKKVRPTQPPSAASATASQASTPSSLPDIDWLIDTLKSGQVTLFGQQNGNSEADITAWVADQIERSWRRDYNFSKLVQPLREVAGKLKKVESRDSALAAKLDKLLKLGLVHQICHISSRTPALT